MVVILILITHGPVVAKGGKEASSGFQWSTEEIHLRLVTFIYSSGHLGVNATYQRIKGSFYWKGLGRDVPDLMKGDTCLRCKYEIVASPGLLQPLTLPKGV